VRWSILLALACFACASAPPRSGRATSAGPATAPPEQVRALSGTWVFDGGADERAAVDAAVDLAVADMGFLERGFAREALRARSRPREAYTLTFEGDGVTIASPDEPPERGRIGGPAVSLTNRFGDESQTTFQLENGALVESGASTDGSGRTVFEPAPDGQSLQVFRLMQSKRISAPVVVTFTYRRRE
jgi:hypothetical protein